MGLSPAPEAEKRQLIRRLSFDLTGLPPTPEEVDAFLNDRSPDAYERLVDRYLASPQYGVRWARWWLDLARYGESNGFEYDEFRPTAWRYRDWVVDALNRDRPYDEFARLQLAGDVLRPDDPGAVEATGFLVAGAYDTAGQNQQSLAMKAVVRSDELEDIIGTVSQTFLGLTVNCARCHDHKFDPVRQVEYYQIASALSGVRHGERDLSGIDPETVAARKQIEALLARIAAIEAPARARIVAERKKAVEPAPTPWAAWDFDRGLDDRIGSLKVALQGSATLTPEGLRLDGKTGYAVSAPLPRELKAKTIEAWVRLDNLEQRGGGAISIQTRDGGRLRRDRLRRAGSRASGWRAASSFAATAASRGEAEKEAVNRAVHVAITYADDGTIRVFRDGRPYGTPYKSSGPVAFPAGEAQVVFGLRHAPAGGNRMLAGTIVRARVYDRALDEAEVAASAATFGDYVDPESIAAALTPECRAERARLMGKVEKLRSSLARSRAQGIRRVAARGGRDARADPGEPQPARRAGGGRWRRGDRRARGRVRPGRRRARGPAARAAGVVDRQPAQPALRAGRGQPALAGTLRSGPGRDVQRPRLQRRHALAPRAARLAGLRDGRARLEHQGDAPADRHVGRLSSVVAAGRRRRSSATPATACSGARPRRGSRPRWFATRCSRSRASSIRGWAARASATRRSSRPPGTPAVLYAAVDPRTPGLNRRTLFRAWARGGRSPLLDAFDCPDPSTTAPRRAVTTTPLQALSLMNNALVLYLSDAFAARLAREAGPDAGRQVERAYRLAFGRGPEPDERARAGRVVERFGAATLARAIFNSNEFLYLD